jgi:hypothetical protein
MPQFKTQILLITAVGISALTGCGQHDQWERVVVSGMVTYNGQPVEKGQIRFIPAEGTSGPITVDPIDLGKYDTTNTGGVPVGTHRIEIVGYSAKEYATASTGPGAPPVRQLLPKKYNSQTKLKETIDLSQTERTLDFNLMP